MPVGVGDNIFDHHVKGAAGLIGSPLFVDHFEGSFGCGSFRVRTADINICDSIHKFIDLFVLRTIRAAQLVIDHMLKIVGAFRSTRLVH